MHRILLSTFLFCTLLTTTRAQFVQRIGMQQGLSISRLLTHYQPDPTPGIDDESSILTGYSARIHADLLPGRHFHLSPGIGFTQRGGTHVQSQLTAGESIGRMATASTLGYLNMDLSAKALLPLGRIAPYVFAGPRYDVLLNASTNFQDFDERQTLNRSRTGLRYGGGVSLEAGPIAAFVEWCGLWDANDVTQDTTLPIRNSEGRPQDANVRISDRTFTLGVGIAVKLCPGATN